LADIFIRFGLSAFAQRKVMDWMPWRIACNFIRVFFPTFLLLLSWDVCRRLAHAAPATRLALCTDAIALAIVLAIRLSSPWSGLREQLRYYFFGRTWIGWMVFVCVPLTFLFPERSPESLFGLLGCVFYTDLSRVCKTDIEERIHSIRWGYGILAWIFSGAVVQVLEDAFLWRDVLVLLAFLLVVIAVVALKWWVEGPEPAPYIQKLGLNQ